MIKNYFKTTFRFLLKNKTFSFINIIGLATGTLCCVYILLYLLDQNSYDKQHVHAGSIYRIVTSLTLTGDKHNMATASPPIARAMKNDFPEVEQFARVIPLLGVSRNLIRYKERSFYEKEARLVDSTFFDVFTYHFNNGNAASALQMPYSVVLLKPLADKLFGKEDPIGKTVEIDNAWEKKDFTVTGVVDESLGKSHIHTNIFISLNGYSNEMRDDNVWTGNNFTASYVKLVPGADAIALEKKLPAFLNKYAADELKNRGMQKQLHLQPVTAIHTTPGYDAESGKIVSSTFLYFLLLIAVLIQLIACINFMNLSTARASVRAKEVGVRKVIGAGRKNLVLQFLSESFFLSLLSVLIAMPLLVLAMPYLNQITGADIDISVLTDYRIWLTLAGVVIVTGLVAGSYPAFYLSTFDAIKVIKGNFTSHLSAEGIRRSLVIFQFVLSIALIAGIIVIYSQLNYIKNKDLGFDKTQKLAFTFYTGESKSKMPVFMNDLRQLPEVNNVSKANTFPGHSIYHNWGVFLAGGNIANSINQQNLATDENFVKTMGITLASGRDFRLHDSGKVLINETLATRLGLKTETAPGTRLYTQDSAKTLEIAGVMKDFNYQSLRENVGPFMLIYRPAADDVFNVIINTSSKDYKTLLKKIQTIWQKDVPAVPFDYIFLDDFARKQYETEITQSRIINAFTIIAILISCLGLFGLASFSAEKRKKEIGVRKVLGANPFNLTVLLSKDFLKLVILAIMIAVPISWWLMDKWLQAFAYRITISWWMFALAGLMAILVALFTISFQTVKAAFANPVKSLRTE